MKKLPCGCCSLFSPVKWILLIALNLPQRTTNELFPLRLSVPHNSSFPLYFTWQGSDQHYPNCKWTFIFFLEAGSIIFYHLRWQIQALLQVLASFEEFSLSLMSWRNKEVEQKKTFSLSEVSQPDAPCAGETCREGLKLICHQTLVSK